MCKVYIISFLAIVMVNCGEDTGSVESVAGTISKSSPVSITMIKETPVDMLRTLAQMADGNEFAKLVRYSVRTYRLVYETTFQGRSINTSGLLYVPMSFSGKAPLISLQHGTTFRKQDAPSTSTSFSGMEYFAAAGYIAIMPDYIGYGESSALFHPYYNKQYSASAVIDMIKAAKKFLIKEDIPFNDQLFLAGYSEGGFVTLAAAKEMENNSNDQLTVTAVAAGAGGYDLENMVETITHKTYYAYPSYLAFVIMSYNNTYQWNKPLTHFFKPEYANALQKYMNGKNDGWYLNSRLTTSIPSLLDSSFYRHLHAGTDTTFNQVLKDNSVGGWHTKIPMRLYHGTNDEIIPYRNSEVTRQNFKDAGSRNVTLKLIPRGSHGSTFVPMLEDFVPWFETMRE